MTGDQLSLFGEDAVCMTNAELAAIAADMRALYSGTVRTTGALQVRTCRCEPSGIDYWETVAFEARCLRCGRAPG